MAITLTTPQLEWDEVCITATRTATTNLAREVTNQWMLEGQMELAHGKFWFRKLKKMKYFDSRPVPGKPMLMEYLDVAVTDKKRAELLKKTEVTKRIDNASKEQEKSAMSMMNKMFQEDCRLWATMSSPHR